MPLVLSLTESLAQTSSLMGVIDLTPLVTMNVGQTATITVTASGTPTAFQWQRMAANTSTWVNLNSGGVYGIASTATSSALTVSNTTLAMSGDEFQCVVTYSTGTVTSDLATTLVVENPATVSTFVGDAGTAGLTTNVSGTAAQFDYPTGIVIDSLGDFWVTDLDNNEIREISPSGAVTTPYGSLTGAANTTTTIVNGTGNNALFDAPRDIAIDSSNNLYVSDEGNNAIREIATTGTVTTINTNNVLYEPRGICLDSAGNIYVADSGNNVIREIVKSSGSVIVFAGSSSFASGYKNATGTGALFNQPIGLAIDTSGNLYVADFGNEAIRKITTGGVVTTLAGQAGVAGCRDGTGTQALFNLPRGLTVDSSGNVYVTDSNPPIGTLTFSGNNLLRKITPAGVVTTLAGQAGVEGTADGTGNAAQFFNPVGITLNSSGILYLTDASNNTIRSVVPASISVSATVPVAWAKTSQTGQFTITRTGSTTSSQAVTYSVSGSTAVAGNRLYRSFWHGDDSRRAKHGDDHGHAAGQRLGDGEPVGADHAHQRHRGRDGQHDPSDGDADRWRRRRISPPGRRVILTHPLPWAMASPMC